MTAVRVATERLGILDVPEEQILNFPEGLPGFPEDRSFTLVEVPESDAFFWFQSLNDPALAFLAVVPWAFFPDYTPELPASDQEALALEREEDALVVCLVTVLEGTISANLLGPVVINRATRVGRQIALVDSEYHVRAPLPVG